MIRRYTFRSLKMAACGTIALCVSSFFAPTAWADNLPEIDLRPYTEGGDCFFWHSSGRGKMRWRLPKKAPSTLKALVMHHDVQTDKRKLFKKVPASDEVLDRLDTSDDDLYEMYFVDDAPGGHYSRVAIWGWDNSWFKCKPVYYKYGDPDDAWR